MAIGLTRPAGTPLIARIGGHVAIVTPSAAGASAAALVGTASGQAILAALGVGSCSVEGIGAASALAATGLVSLGATGIAVASGGLAASCLSTLDVAAADPYPIPLGAAAWVAYWDARHGVAVDGSNNVTSWTSRVGSAVLTPPGNAPVYNATGSSTNGPTITFTAASTQYLTTTNAALIAVFAGDDLPCSVVSRASVAATYALWAATVSATSNSRFWMRANSTSIMRLARRSGASGEVDVDITCTPANEQTWAMRHTGTAGQLYAGGWGSETAQDVGTVSDISVFSLGAAIVSGTAYYHLNGVITAIGVASTALSTGDCDIARAAMALL